MSILESLKEMTDRNRLLDVSIAQEVLACKAILRQARQEGGFDLVLMVVSTLEGPIQVCHIRFKFHDLPLTKSLLQRLIERIMGVGPEVVAEEPEPTDAEVVNG